MVKSVEKQAVLLLAFGGLESINSIEPFLNNIMGGRKLKQNQIEDITERYNLIGGKSPLSEITHAQALAMENCFFNQKGLRMEVFVGMRHWHPYIKDTLKKIHEKGIKHLIVICMTPQMSNYTINGYLKDLKEGMAPLNEEIEITFIKEWHNNSLFQKSITKRVSEELNLFRKEKTLVIFSAHSLPKRVLSTDDPYVDQIKSTIKGVISNIDNINWKMGYQSKGLTPGEWLNPSVDTILEASQSEGISNVIIVPVGFVADHIETLFDIDITYSKKAQSLGLNFSRTKSLNDSPDFIESLCEIVLEKGSNR